MIIDNNLIQCARGIKKADIVIHNAMIANVFTCEFIKGNVAVYNGMIAGIGDSYTGNENIDAHGKFLIPSFIDAHCHIESSMLSPAEYARAVIPKGVTCVIADPHEITNVAEEAGIDFMFRSAKLSPLDVRFMLPSCVPAMPGDSSGCEIDSHRMRILSARYPFWGLGEIMNVPGVLDCDIEMLNKLNILSLKDGHCPLLSGNELNAYICAGIKTDHESVSAEEALEKIRSGMYVLVREGTCARNLNDLISITNASTAHRMCFCSDDKHLSEILSSGTISDCFEKSIANGISPINTVLMSSFNAAKCFGLDDTGAIAPGYHADLLICGSLSPLKIEQVYHNGTLLAQNGQPLFSVNNVNNDALKFSVKIKPINENDLAFEHSESVPAISVKLGSLITTQEKVKSSDGLCRCAVIERHNKSGRIGKAFVKGLRISNGAVAESIGHDSHNIIVLGDNVSDMAQAVNALGTSGGIAVCSGKEVTAYMELPTGGLMTDKTVEEADVEYEEVIKALKKICGEEAEQTLMLLSFIPLRAIPEIRLSDRGLYDVVNHKYIK